MSLPLSAIALLLGVLLLLSRASEPSMVLAEQGRTQDARSTVVVLETRVAAYPTPTPRRGCMPTPYFYSC